MQQINVNLEFVSLALLPGSNEDVPAPMHAAFYPITIYKRHLGPNFSIYQHKFPIQNTILRLNSTMLSQAPRRILMGWISSIVPASTRISRSTALCTSPSTVFAPISICSPFAVSSIFYYALQLLVLAQFQM